MLKNKNNFWKNIFFCPFTSGLIDRCVIRDELQTPFFASQLKTELPQFENYIVHLVRSNFCIL